MVSESDIPDLSTSIPCLCPSCKGSGEYFNWFLREIKECSTCRGTGSSEVKQELLAEKARGEFKDKSAKKFKTAKEAIDYLHNL